MERQKKPWSEMTEEERQEIRESWKHTLPEEFDVFCINDFVPTMKHLEIPGDLYVGGDVNAFLTGINVTGSLFVGFSISAGSINVGKDFIAHTFVDCNNVNVGGNFLVLRGHINALDITVKGDLVVNDNIDSTEINVGNLLDCYEISFNPCAIHAPDFVCRHYEEENQ